jgi:hypothetical protein
MLPRPGRAAAGVLYIVVSATCYGAMPVFAEFAYQHGTDVRAVLLIRFAVAGLVPAVRLASNVGLGGLVAEHVQVAATVGANPGLKGVRWWLG